MCIPGVLPRLLSVPAIIATTASAPTTSASAARAAAADGGGLINALPWNLEVRLQQSGIAAPAWPPGIVVEYKLFTMPLGQGLYRCPAAWEPAQICQNVLQRLDIIGVVHATRSASLLPIMVGERFQHNAGIEAQSPYWSLLQQDRASCRGQHTTLTTFCECIVGRVYILG